MDKLIRELEEDGRIGLDLSLGNLLSLRASEMLIKCKLLFDHPEGCRCGNNGGADCNWCKIVNDLKLGV